MGSQLCEYDAVFVLSWRCQSRLVTLLHFALLSWTMAVLYTHASLATTGSTSINRTEAESTPKSHSLTLKIHQYIQNWEVQYSGRLIQSEINEGWNFIFAVGLACIYRGNEDSKKNYWKHFMTLWAMSTISTTRRRMTSRWNVTSWLLCQAVTTLLFSSTRLSCERLPRSRFASKSSAQDFMEHPGSRTSRNQH